jgi:hypothetical protein
VTFEWLPISGLYRTYSSFSASSPLPGTVTAIYFNSTDSASGITYLYVGGEFDRAVVCGGDIPLYNIALSCLCISENGTMAGGILLSTGCDINDALDQCEISPPAFCGLENRFGYFQSVGGTNGPITTIAPLYDMGKNDLIVGGHFTSSEGRPEHQGTNGCPILRYSLIHNVWSPFPEQSTSCFGSVLALSPYTPKLIGIYHLFWIFFSIALFVIILFSLLGYIICRSRQKHRVNPNFGYRNLDAVFDIQEDDPPNVSRHDETPIIGNRNPISKSPSNSYKGKVV